MAQRRRRRPSPGARHDLDFLALDVATFGAAPKNSIDYAVMERTQRAAVVPADIGWSDVGNWDAVWKLSNRDADGNSFPWRGRLRAPVKKCPYPLERGVDGGGRGQRRGDRHHHRRGAGAGPRPRRQGQGGRRGAQSCASARRPSSTSACIGPWGYYQSIDHGPRYQVKRIVVTPGSPAVVAEALSTAPSIGSS